MTASIIHLDTFRCRRATGQPLFDKPAPRTIPIQEVRRPERIGITGMRVQAPDGRIGTVTGTFQVCGMSYARVQFSFSGVVDAVAIRDLAFIDNGPECA
jgi:hypothetical protein